MTERSESERAELPHWNDPDVQAIYKTLCDPVVEDGFKKQMYTDGGHWEGWIARNIASALRRLAVPDQKPVALDPLEMLLDAARYAEGNGGKYRNPEWAKAARAAVAKARLSAQDQKPPPAAGWHDGPPPRPWCNEWFIAQTTFNDRVVLTALPEDFTYDFKTADDTYVKADKIKRWMQFPDSQYVVPDHGGADAVVKLKRLLTAAKILQQNAVACATNHYGHDCELNGLPGWLNDTQKDIEASEVAANASAEARDFCTYGPPDERKRQWIIVFEDADRGMMIFSDEREAHTAWDKAKDNWTCTLFETSERKYHWAAGELRPLNASAEARLREALEPFAVLGRSLYEANQRSDQSVLIGASAEFLNLRPLIGQHFVNAHLALSAYPHASDCFASVTVPASGIAKLMDALENPKQPNEALKKLMRGHASDCDKQGER